MSYNFGYNFPCFSQRHIGRGKTASMADPREVRAPPDLIAARPIAAGLLRLNMGSGLNPLHGYINVDKEGEPDQRVDLEVFPWPWGDSTIGEMVWNHSMEHMGATPGAFIGIMREIWRVGADGCRVLIIVPHPRHDNFMNDPTHVRPVTPEMFHLFSKKANLECVARGAANSPLALYHEIDFEVTSVQHGLDESMQEAYQSGKVGDAEIHQMARLSNNILAEYRIELKVMKERLE